MVGILLGLMLLIPLWGAVSTWRDYLLVHQSGMIETQATILKRYVAHGYQRSSRFCVVYAFRIPTASDGLATYSNRCVVGLSLFRDLATSSDVMIRYLPANPRISEIEGNDHEFVLASILSVASLFSAIVLVAFLINPRILALRVARRARIATRRR